METITYSQVQELVMRLPETRLPLAYRLLLSIADDELEALAPQLNFLVLPMSERERILAQQAEQMVAHYDQTAVDRELWQAGDFVDES